MILALKHLLCLGLPFKGGPSYFAGVAQWKSSCLVSSRLGVQFPRPAPRKGRENMRVEKVNISELKPHPKNPRIHPDSAIEKLKRSIEEFGWTNPILVSKDGYILAGHARLKAAKKAGIQEVPVIYLELEGAKAAAYLIADNRLQDETDWDMELLRELVAEIELEGVDLEITGLDIDEINELNFEDIGYKEKEEKGNPPTMKIVFECEQDFRRMEDDLRELLEEKYKNVRVSILGGEL